MAGHVVATTWWELEDDERLEIAKQIGPDGLTAKPVEILRRYGASAPEWDLPIDYPKAVDFLSKRNASTTTNRNRLLELRVTNFENHLNR